jgi:hypothetical protein
VLEQRKRLVVRGAPDDHLLVELASSFNSLRRPVIDPYRGVVDDPPASGSQFQAYAELGVMLGPNPDEPIVEPHLAKRPSSKRHVHALENVNVPERACPPMVVACYAAIPPQLPDRLLAAVHESLVVVHPVAPPNPRDHRIWGKDLLNPMEPVAVRLSVVVCERHDIPFRGLHSGVQRGHEALTMYVGNPYRQTLQRLNNLARLEVIDACDYHDLIGGPSLAD